MKKILAVIFGTVTLLKVYGQTYETVHGFAGPDGSYPCSLVLSSNRFYGAAEFGVNSPREGSGVGAIFAVNIDGSGFTNLVLFNGTNGQNPTSVIVSSNKVFGVTVVGGAQGSGTIFSMDTTGSNFTTLHTFDGTNSGSPQPNLLLVSNVLYGTAFNPGSGRIYRMNTNGTGYSNIYTFSVAGIVDGQNPATGLIFAGNRLYGTTENGGANGSGTIFCVSTNGTGFTNLHNFSALDPDAQTNVDGANPTAVLAIAGGRLFGTANAGGAYQNGTVFSIGTNGAGFTNLHQFTGGSDGAEPAGEMVASGTMLYGTAQFGGQFGTGTVFGIGTNGTGFTNVYNFSAASGNMDGANPVGDLVLSSNILYGTASDGGETGDADEGVVFGLALSGTFKPARPTLSIALTGGKYVVSWPTTNSGFNLQTKATVTSGSWATISNGVVSNGVHYVYSNAPTGAAFFRLEQ